MMWSARLLLLWWWCATAFSFWEKERSASSSGADAAEVRCCQCCCQDQCLKVMGCLLCACSWCVVLCCPAVCGNAILTARARRWTQPLLQLINGARCRRAANGTLARERAAVYAAVNSLGVEWWGPARRFSAENDTCNCKVNHTQWTKVIKSIREIKKHYRKNK